MQTLHVVLFLLLVTSTRLLMASPLFYPEDGGFGPEPSIPWLPEDDQHFDEIPE